MTLPLLSLAHLSVLDAHPLELLDAAHDSGFDAIGLRIVPPTPSDPMVPVVGDEALIQALLARLRDSAVRVFDVETIWIGEGFDLDALRPTLALGQRLGASNVLTMGTDPDEARLTANFARLCEAAAGFGLRVGLEFAAYTHTPDIHAARRIVSAAGQPNGGMLIDSLHLVRSGGTAADVASLAPASITGFQLADGCGPRPASNEALRAEARGGRFFPGDGEFPLAAILGALPAGMPLCVETPCAQYASLPVRQRARLCAEQTRKFLASGDKP